MEKPTTEYRKHFQRLLTIFIALFACEEILFADTRKPEYSFHIISQQKYCFTQTDSQFTLRIDGVSPEKVQAYVDALPENVSFVSLRKDELAGNANSNGESGTMIRLWFQFKKPGTYQLGQLVVSIAGKIYKPLFDTITVYENPATVQPQVSISFLNQAYPSDGGTLSCHANEHLRFTVYVQYAVQIINVSWDIPQDSVFKQVKQFSITEEIPRGGTFSPEKIPVASFDWQPLKSEVCKFPQVQVVATAYNGARVNAFIPEFTVNVAPALYPILPEQKQSAFAYAFAEPTDTKSGKTEIIKSSPNQKKLLVLRVKERHSLPFSSAAKERRRLEEQEGLTTGASEPSVPLFILLLVFTFLSAAGLVILFILRKIKPASIFVVVFTLCVMSSIIAGVEVSRRYALCEGGSVSPIPEEQASTSVTVQAGSRVQVLRDAGGWAYIRFNDTFGWVNKSEIYYIN